jgi:hypothetical protein
MKIAPSALLSDLTSRTRDLLSAAESLRKLPLDALTWKANPESWNALECLDHLNLYGDFYLPALQHAIQNSRFQQPEKEFKSGLLGNYFAESMLPGAKMKPMKTFKDKNPIGKTLSLATVDAFIAQQKQMLELLEMAQKVNLTRTKSPISISKLIRLRLGDTFRFVIFHEQRHIVQAQKVVNASGKGVLEEV